MDGYKKGFEDMPFVNRLTIDSDWKHSPSASGRPPNTTSIIQFESVENSKEPTEAEPEEKMKPEPKKVIQTGPKEVSRPVGPPKKYVESESTEIIQPMGSVAVDLR